MTIKEWAKDFREYVYGLQLPNDDYKGVMEYIDDALELLKEQEAEMPKLMQDAKGIWCVCSNCGYVLKSAIYNSMETEKSFFHFPNFCERCERAVRWNE